MSVKPINPLDLKPKEIARALRQLPESMRGQISAVVKTAAPIQEDKSPEAVRLRNIKALKARRRDLVASLIDLEKEIFLLEDMEYNNNSMTPEAIREFIIRALLSTKAQLGRRNFSLSEARALSQNSDISFASWVSELTALGREGYIHYFEENIILTKQLRIKEASAMQPRVQGARA